MDAREMAFRAWEFRVNMARVALSILHQGADAEDAISEAIIKACQNAESLRDTEHIRTWLMRILVRCCYDILRGRKREIPDADMRAYDSPVLENEEGSVFALIQELPEGYRKILTLHYYEGFKVREIAHVLSMPMGTVAVMLARGRSKLRALLEEEETLYAKQGI